MSGGKYNPAVLWHKLGYRSNKIFGVVKNYFKAVGHQTITFDMQGRQVAVTDESAKQRGTERQRDRGYLFYSQKYGVDES